MNLSALILAGGKSSRMGCDKAWLEIGGQPLIKRQIGIVQQLGITEIFISGRPDADNTRLGYPVLSDSFSDAGPLAGIERGLAIMSSAKLLVLAVDLPQMDASFLRRLADACERELGAVPWAKGQSEPLSAIYPKGTHSIAIQALTGGQYAVRKFVEDCRSAGLVRSFPVEAADERLFLNWNAPDDFSANKG